APGATRQCGSEQVGSAYTYSIGTADASCRYRAVNGNVVPDNRYATTCTYRIADSSYTGCNACYHSGTVHCGYRGSAACPCAACNTMTQCYSAAGTYRRWSCNGAHRCRWCNTDK